MGRLAPNVGASGNSASPIKGRGDGLHLHGSAARRTRKRPLGQGCPASWTAVEVVYDHPGAVDEVVSRPHPPDGG